MPDKKLHVGLWDAEYKCTCAHLQQGWGTFLTPRAIWIVHHSRAVRHCTG